jgi:hypothetical protein
MLSSSTFVRSPRRCTACSSISRICGSTLGLQLSVEEKLDAKLSVADVDPSFVALHDKLAEARKQSEEMTGAAEESWAKLEGATREAMDKLRARVQEASEESKKA